VESIFYQDKKFSKVYKGEPCNTSLDGQYAKDESPYDLKIWHIDDSDLFTGYLGGRALHYLFEHRVLYLGDLKQVSENYLNGIGGLGDSSMMEIKGLLCDFWDAEWKVNYG
jgi:hypothetical protein